MPSKRHFLHCVLMRVPNAPLAERFYALACEHPDLFIVSVETHYFSSDRISKGREWYEAQFAGASAGQKRGELSTSYLLTPGVPARIARDYPDTKLVVVLVDPLESIFTEYMTAKSASPGETLELEAFLEHHPLVLESYKYGKALTNFFTYYSPVDLMVITADDIRANAGRAILKLYDHLELSTAFVPKVLRVLTEDEVKPGFFVRKLRLDRLRKRRRAARERLALSQFPPAIVTMTPRERVLLARYYADDVQRLSSLLNRNLSAEWGWPEVGGAKKS